MAELSRTRWGSPSRLGSPGPSRAETRRAPSVGAGAFPTVAARRRYLVLLAGLGVAAVVVAVAIVAWGNPMPYGSRGFWRIAELRATNLAVIALVVLGQAMATVTFHSAANNRIVTPSILGFEALYVAIQTSSVYLLGAAGVLAVQGLGPFALQVATMVACSMALYGWLLSGRHANLQVLLLVGIVLGGGLASVSTFMQRLLTPSEFDVLAARLFGSVANADAGYLPLAVPLVLVAAAALWWRAPRLNLVSLGREVTVNLGLDHRREVLHVLFWVSILMAVSTALVGPLTFFGFLVATLAYQLTPSWDHRRILAVAVLLGFVVLGGAYVVLKNAFYAEGVVSIIIEAVGGIAFLAVLAKRGRL